MSARDDQTDPDQLIRFATVAEVDLAAGRVVVDTGDVKSAPIRWSSGRAGATRSWSPPTVGEQVLLICPGGELAGAVAIGGIAQDAFPPAGNSLRELVQFGDGAVLAYDPEGHVLDVALPAGATVNITASGGLTIKGDIAIEGDVALTGKLEASGDVVGAGKSLKDHKHTGVAAGGALSGAPQ